MKFFRSLPYIAAFYLVPALAWGQGALLQAGPVTAGHIPMYVTSGTGQAVVQDAGGAGGGGPGVGLSELSLTARGTGTPPYIAQGSGPLGTNFCDYDAPTTNPTGYHYLCFGFGTGENTLIATGFGGGATSSPLVFNVNGTAYNFPFTTGGILGPSVSVAGHVALWNNAVGTLLSDGGFGFTAGTTGQLGYWISGTNFGGLTIGTGLAVGGSALNLQPAQPATIGGIESLTCTAHMWLYTVSTGGVPSCSQPNFADISGTLASTQCPVSSTSQFGCVEPDGSSIVATGGVLSAPGAGVIKTIASGTANAITLTPVSGTVTSYVNQQVFGFLSTLTSTSGPVQVQVGSLGALSLYRPDGSTTFLERDINAGNYYQIVYETSVNADGPGFVLVGPPRSFSQNMTNEATIRLASPGTAKTYLAAYYGGNGLYLYNGTTARWEFTYLNGAYQTIDTTNCIVNGVAGQALAPSTNYYVYAFTTGNGLIQFDHSTTAPVTGGSPNDVTGYNFKTGDQTRREVGAIGTNASSVIWLAGSNGVTYNGIGSYYQRQKITLIMSPQPTGSWSSASWGEINSNNRLNAWWWGDGSEGIAGLSGSVQCSTVGAEVDLGVSIDGANPPLDFQRLTCTASSTFFPVHVGVSSANLTEGMHSLQIWAKASSGSISLEAPMTFYWNILE